MTTIIKAADAAHFLSLMPHVLGFAPARSLVLVPFAGSRSLGAMRLDLPPGEVDAEGFAATCLGLVCRLPDADAVAFVVYCDDVFPDDRPPRGGLARALLSRADACGLRVTDALCVGAEAWGSYVDPEDPPGGRPLADLDLPPAIDGPPIAADHTVGADLPDVDPVEIDRIARALTALEASIAVVCDGRATSRSAAAPDSMGADTLPEVRIDPQALAAVCLLDDLPALFEDALRRDPAELDPYQSAALTWCLARPSLRDVALVQWCVGFAGGDEALDAQLRWEAGEAYPDHLAERMWGEGDPPDPQRLQTALALTRRLAAVAPLAQQPGALAVCAWLSWALGRSTHAERYAAAARDIEPEHGLSEIVLTFVAAGHLPDWAFQRRREGEPPLSRRDASPRVKKERR